MTRMDPALRPLVRPRARQRLRRSALALTAVVALLASACGGSSSDDAGGSSATSANDDAAPTATVAPAADESADDADGPAADDTDGDNTAGDEADSDGAADADEADGNADDDGSTASDGAEQVDPFSDLEPGEALVASQRRGNAFAVRQALARGADPNTLIADVMPVVHLAAEQGQLDVLVALIDGGADIDARGLAGHSALARAAIGGQLEAMQVLIDAGADLDHREDSPGRTIAQLAIDNFADHETIRVLAAAGADLDAADERGETALASAAFMRDLEAAELLVELGAKVDTFNNAGVTPIDWAANNGSDEIVQLLEDAGATLTVGESASRVQRELTTPDDALTPVRFTVDAADAEQVTLEFTGNYWNSDPADTLVLAPVEGEEWSHELTLHLGDGQWLYRYRVDGRWTTDATNPNFVGAENDEQNSVLVVGEPLELVTADPSLPAGNVDQIELDAPATGRSITTVVYTPPGYDPSGSYPLLVLLHGFGQPATDWVEAIGLANAMDRLIAAGEIEPIVVAMPGMRNSFYQGPYRDHVIDDLVPYLESNYAIATGPDTAAIGGFSAGGFGSLEIAYRAQDRFGLVMPIAMASYCGDLVCTSVDEFERAYPEPFDAEFAMWVGSRDELGLRANHDLFAEMLAARGQAHRHTVSTSDGHRRDGHSVRYVRTIVGDLLRTASAWFGGESVAVDPALVADGCDVDYPDWQSSPYVLPYPVGESYTIDLDNCSASFHGASQPDAFAYDFDMERGTPLVASRAGTVTVVVDDQPDLSGTGGGNLVIIDHGDGTAAAYLHLDVDGIDVAEGDTVAQGQPIGRSGATGSNTGYPHLHFIVVETPSDFPWTGVPVTFANTQPNPRGLVSGLTYEALPG